jgi:hypothetical protein
VSIKKLIPLIVVLSLTTSCIHAQTGKAGGTGGVGGTGGWLNGNRPAMFVATASLPDGTVNVAYSQTLSATNGIGTLSWTILLGQLPPGLTLNSATGVLSGTPTTPGVSTFTILVTDSASPTHQTATMQFSIPINCAAFQQTSTSPLPSVVAGSAYSFQFQSQGGQGSVTWTQTGAPAGLALSTGGLLSGSTLVVGTSTISVTATDSCPVPQTVVIPYALTVNAGVTIVTAGTLAPATTGTPYQIQLAAQGGTAPYTWTLSSGTLPAGLSLSSAGVISGTPTGVGTSSVTIAVNDSASGTNSQAFTITVSCVPVSVTSSTTLPNAAQNQSFTFQFTSTGGFGTITWSLANGTSLPNGLSLSPSGLLSGTPTLAGTSSFDVSAADSCPVVQMDGNTFSLTVSAGLTITTSGTLPNATLGSPYSVPLSVSGGIPPYSWSAPAGTIPAGAEDILDYAAMPVATRYTSHLAATGLYKAYRLNAGLLWWMKNSQGYPWDGELVGDTYVGQWFTEMDSSQNAQCIAAGWPSCFSDPQAYKKYRTPVSLWKRYHVPGADDVVFTPGPNIYDLTVNCGADNQTGIDNKGVRGELTGPFTDVTWQTTYGGSIPDNTPYLLAQKWTKCTANDITTCQNEEDYWLVKGYGQVRWCPKTWNGATYVTGTCTTQANVVAGGAPTPNFACKIPSLPTPPNLPPGVTSPNSTELNLDDKTGVIGGTPSATGTYTFNVQVEDSTGAFAQKSMTVVASCNALVLSSTSPIPKATQGQAYSFQFLATGGLAPVSWAIIQGTLPAGLSLSSSGLLSGTPTATGVFTFVPQAVDSCAPQQQSVQSQFQISVQANSGALTIQTASPLPNAIEGSSYTTPLNATGGTTPYVWSISAGSLPTGMSLSSSSGAITGTPTATGVSSFTAKVTDALTVFTTKAFSLTVACPAFSLVSTSPIPAATQGQPYSFQFTSAGGISPVSWGATSIPSGLALSNSGLLSGTPTGTGTTSISVTATDSCLPSNQTANGSFSLTVNAAPVPVAIATTSPLAGATQGVAYNVQMAASGGTPPYIWSITAGSLPAGLTLSSGGVISGTPTTIGTSTPTIKVADSLGANASGSFSITVSCTSLSIATAALPSGTQNSPYSFQMTKSGGIGSVSWSLFAGSFPTGVSIAAGGLISGTPSVSGAFSPQIRVTDSCSTPQTATTTFPLTINPSPVPLQITTSSLPAATQNQAYSVTLAAAGGTPPYGSWTVTVGTLPTGLTLSSSTGVISGTPTGTGTSSFTLRVSDSVAATATQALSITVNAVTGANNPYCNSNNQVINLVQDGPALPLAQCMNTALANTPSPGTVRGPDSTTTAVQADINAAACGDTILVTAGSNIATITLPAKTCDNAHWITIKSTGVSNGSFPPEGTRMTPCWSGVASLPGRPAYVCPSPAVLTFTITAPLSGNSIVMNGDHYRIIGAKITRNQAHGIVFALVTLPGTSAPFPNNFILDRVWGDGVEGKFPQSTTNSTETKRFLDLGQSNHVALIDSYITNMYCDGSISACDSQVIGGGFGTTANSGWGVYKMTNTHAEAAAEGILFGGAAGPPLTPTGCTIMVNCNIDRPSDIEIRLNHFFKPPQWNGNTTTVVTAGWPIVKNGFEMKTGIRALFEGNVIENCWYNAQGCNTFSVAPVNQQSGAATPTPTCPTCGITDFTYRYNYSFNALNGIAIYAFIPTTCSTCNSQGANRVSIHDNLIGDNMNMGSLTLSTGDALDTTATQDATNRGLNKLQNVTIAHNTFVKALRASLLFGDANGTTKQYVNFVYQNNITGWGKFSGWITPGTPNGCATLNNTSLFNAMNACASPYTYDHNVIFNVAGTLTPNWPTDGHGAGNFFQASSSGVQFTNYGTGNSGFNPSNYILLNTSPYHNAASDGTDIGANIPKLMQMIAGVRQ